MVINGHEVARSYHRHPDVQVTTLTTAGENTLLAGLRHALGDADELLA